MYAAFASFLNRPTWHTNHELDDAEFYRCLSHVVCLEGFNPETMGSEFRKEKGAHFDERIDSFVLKAWAVHDYLKVTGGC
ncbi:UNVERIFIED_ORG: hypothetical protein LHK14_13290 [Roseateles sp. XES5]|nr:hypothetical protein [Roseateles sp. XES5]